MHQLISDELTVSINPFGAEICSIKNKTGTEFIWQADKEIWARHTPVLFPIVGKLKDNTFVFEREEYTLSQHGFARDRDFSLVESTADACTFQLVSDDASKKMYPFDFIFRINYRLEHDTLITNYMILNPSEKPLFFSVGAHPGFNCPLSPNKRMEDYYLEFEHQEYEIRTLSQGLRARETKKINLDGNKLFLSPDLFENDALVFENNQINKISLCSSISAHKITMICESWPYFGIWSKLGQPFVCLEPWYGIADAENTNKEFIQKEGIIALAQGEKFERHFSVAIA